MASSPSCSQPTVTWLHSHSASRNAFFGVSGASEWAQTMSSFAFSSVWSLSDTAWRVTISFKSLSLGGGMSPGPCGRGECGYAPLRGIVNPRLNRCDLSHCFHIFLAGRFSTKSRSLTFPLLLLSSATGVGGMDFWSLLVLQEPLVFFPSDLFRASDLIEWLYGSLKPASQWYRAFLLTKQFCIQYLICFSP